MSNPLSIRVESPARRLDLFLASHLSDLSRSRLQALLRAGHVTLNGRAPKAHQALRTGDVVCVAVPPPVRPARLEAEDIPLRILHSDADIVVLDKPAGLVVHPAAGHASGTLVNALLHACPDIAGIGGELRPGIVHRLDRDTSGCIVCAKHDAAMAGLVRQFKGRAVRKEYLAIVHGVPSPARGRIETLIGRSGRDRKRMSAAPPRGRPAATNYEVVRAADGFALLRLLIETGRTHQIRVHMAYIGHPVLGDSQYGGRRGRAPLPARAPRQMLHAWRLAFAHPASGAALAFEAPLPPDFVAALDAFALAGPLPG